MSGGEGILILVKQNMAAEETILREKKEHVNKTWGMCFVHMLLNNHLFTVLSSLVVDIEIIAYNQFRDRHQFIALFF